MIIIPKNMKRIKLFVGSLFALLLLHSCYKDKGNYDYTNLDEVVIDTSVAGIQAEYSVYRYDTLSIFPRIYLNGVEVTSEAQVEGKLDFTWTIFQATTGGTVYSRDTLSKHMHLEAEITKPAGIWIVHLAVKEVNTKVETYTRFTVNVSEALSDGWMVLYEREGTTDVGVWVDERIKAGVVTPRLFLDLVRNSNGAALEGKPMAMVHSIGPLSSGDVLIASEKDMIGVDRSSFQTTFGFENLFWSAPAQRSIRMLTGTPVRKEYVVNNNKVHTVNFASSGVWRTNFFGAPMNGEYGELENWNPNYIGGVFDAVVYDKTNRRFLYVGTNGTSLVRFPTQTGTPQFEPDDVGLDMKAHDWGLSNYEYLIMSNATNTYLLMANFMAAANTVGMRKVDMTNSPDVQNITTMASAFAGQYVLYGANSSVYLFRYNSGQNAEALWTAPAGEKVTCVRFQKFFHAQFQTLFLPNPNRVVYIATWNEATQTGKVYSYFIDPSNGSIDLSSERVAEGFGKVKDMSYKWNL